MSMKLVVPVEVSANAVLGVRYAISLCRGRPDAEALLVNVQPRLPRHASRFAARQARAALRRERAAPALDAAQAACERAGVRCSTHVLSGSVAESVAGFAERARADAIIVGARRQGVLPRILGGSHVPHLVETSRVPVTVVANGAPRFLERFALPAGLTAAMSLLFLAD
jgi:nucleotide-binding universal stress UspA family protein